MSRSDALRSFYKGRVKLNKRDRFPYSPEGNLEERDKSGAVLRTHVLPTYRAPNAEEWKEMDEKRNRAIAEATDMYQQARIRLHQEYHRPERSDETVLECNRAVQRADIMLQRARFPLQYVEKEENVVIRTMDESQPNEIRKYPYSIAILQHRPYELQASYVRIADAGAQPHIGVAEARAIIPTDPILFSDTDGEQPYGFMSLNFKSLIQIKNDKKQLISYPTARHALLAHMAMEFKDEENYKRILQTEQPEALTYSVKDVPVEEQEEWNKKLKKWVGKVSMVKFTQHPELAQRLKETDPSPLGAIEPDDDKIGIGMAANAPTAKQPATWKKNWLGRALMLIRENIIQSEQAKTDAEEVKEEKEQAIKLPEEPIAKLPEASALPRPKKKMGKLPTAPSEVAVVEIAPSERPAEPAAPLELPSESVAPLELPAASAVQAEPLELPAAPAAPAARRRPRMGTLPQ